MVGPSVTPAIEVSQLSYAYPDGHRALFDVDLRVESGERLAVLGPNGSGKTTLALHLNGIHQASRGTVRIKGTEVTPATVRDIRRRVGIVFQDPDDQLFMPSVRDDVAFGPANLGFAGADLDACVDRALTAVGMLDHAPRAPHHLSFGQRRRVAVATVLAMGPEILVLDEPTSNLDPASRRELHDVLVGLDQTLVVITHDLPYALELCPRSVVVNEGQIVADDATHALLSDRGLMAANRLELPYGFDPGNVETAS
ncbi:MAG: ABC transporter ATP-binding protein [Acidimicrobiales bacterium]|nr:ABC transporter ATP-binding protein [Acidimicrobiales bacterium]